MQNLIFKKATNNDLKNIVHICQKVVKFMIEEQKLDQWSSQYPVEENFRHDIENEQLYLLVSNNDILGFICINKQCYEQYNQVTWEEKEDFKTLHRVAVNPNFHNKGYGKLLYDYAEKTLKEQGINYVRVDTYSLNIPMNNLIKKCGYSFKGQMDFTKGKAPWNCYEKK